MITECVFCKIRMGELPGTKLYEDKDFMIIKDINPQAKVHLLVVPHEHVPYLDMISEDGAALFGKIILKVAQKKEELGLADGYRIIINQGANATSNTIEHVHFHILAGEKLKEI